MKECPNCNGKGTWRKCWNEKYWKWAYGIYATVDRYEDQICPRCNGKGVVEE